MEEKLVEGEQELEDISLKELLLKIKILYRYFLNKWFIIVICGIIGAGLGFTYAYTKNPVYIAVTSFVLEDGGKVGGLGQYDALASMAGVDPSGNGGEIFQGDNLLELYKSRTMLKRALLSEVQLNGRKQLLIDRYIQLNNLQEKWKSNPKTANLSFKKSADEVLDRTQDSVITVIAANLNRNYMLVSKPDKKISIIQVEVKSVDELFAKAFDEQIVKTVNDFYIQTKTKKALKNLAILQHQTDSVRNVLNGAIYTTVSVGDATPNLNQTRQILRAPGQKSQFNAEINKAILSQLVQNLELSKLTLRNEMPLIQMVDGPIFPLPIDKLGKSTAVIFGAIFGGFFCMIFLLIRKVSQFLWQ